MSYATNKRQLEDLQRRTARAKPTAHVVTGIDDEEKPCSGPQYTLHYSWAPTAIFDRTYDARGPAHHWRFNVIGRAGVTVIVTPFYEPRSVGLAREAEWRREHPGDSIWTVEECAAMHAEDHGSSNWETSLYFLLRVVEEHKPTIHGYGSWEDYCYIYLPNNDKALAQAVLDSLWAATQGDPRAFAGAAHCAFCHHALTDALSSARGYGPDCCDKYGLPKAPRPPSDPHPAERGAV